MRIADPKSCLALFFCLLISACGNEKIPVSVHGVNYSGEEFSYGLIDPKDPTRPQAGELIGEYGAGGIVCCYDLPKKWQPGLRLTLRVHDYRLDADGNFVDKDLTVDVPKYPLGKPGEMWVQRFDDGSYALVLSNYQPDHPAWPGRIKGWPVPSLEYRRKRWDIEIETAEGSVENYKQLLALLGSKPDVAARESWDFKRSQFEDLKKFSGPTDTNFRAMISGDYLEGLQHSEKKLKKLRENRP